MLGMFARTLAIALLLAWVVPVSQAATPPAKEDRLTADNYGKIQNGMTTAEVKEILGPPQLTVTSGSSHDSSMEWRTKTPPVHKIEVQLREGLVVSKSTNIALAPAATKPAPPVRVEKTAEDKFDAALANLSSPDVSKHARAIEFFQDAPLNPARADEVSRLLVKSLSAKDPRITMTAEQAIRKWATKESADYFLKIIDHPQLERNGMEKHMGQITLALDILARLKEPAAVPGMVKMLKHFFNRSDAIEALKRMGPELAEKELQKSANDPNAEVRKAVEEILQEFRDGGPNLAAYLKDLKSPKWELRLGAVQKIGKMYPHPRHRAEVARELEGMLDDENGNVVQAAAHALGRWGAAENEAALMKALAHASADVRREAAQSLRDIGTPKALPALEALEADKDHRVTVAAREAIAVIRSRSN
jgi:HEAT repeat protein